MIKSIDKFYEIKEKHNSILCVGLDSDLDKTPEFLGKNVYSLLEFNRQIIEATKDLVCAYKINFAFYEQYGVEGIEVLKKTFDLIPSEIFTIADAKRGDIGNTSKAYARSVYDYFGADSITVHPYMGYDSVRPFLEFEGKFVFLLALTSNNGSKDFQYLEVNGEKLYKKVLSQSVLWGDAERLGYVVGATHPEELGAIRNIVSDRLLLIPGVGVQGGDVELTLKANRSGLAIINVSRDVIYVSNGVDFAEKSREKAIYYRDLFNLYK